MTGMQVWDPDRGADMYVDFGDDQEAVDPYTAGPVGTAESG